MVFVSSLDVVLKRKSEIECWAKGFSPPQIMFKWTRAGEKIPTPYKLQVNHTEDGLYDAVSWLTFIPDLSDQNTTFGCEVQHKALVKPTTKKFEPRVIGMFTEFTGVIINIFANKFCCKQVICKQLRIILA